MQAVIHDRYGSADVLRVAETPRPEIGDREVLVRVYAASVTTADWRMRAAEFGALGILGRLMFGVAAPRNRIPGSDFAGRIVSVGKDVTRFKLGDSVFGSASHGAHAEYVAVGEDAVVARMPEGFGHDEAAAVPFGALSALCFLRDFGKLRPGQKVLVTGASGGVGVWAVQIAKHLGAEVTGVASSANAGLVRALGAHRVIDYRTEDLTRSAKDYDLVFDTVGATSFAKIRRALRPGGIYLPMDAGLVDILRSAVMPVSGGRRVAFRISGQSQADLDFIGELLASGALRPVIDSHFPLARIADAHRRVEGRHKTGSVIVTVKQPEAPARTTRAGMERTH